MVTVPETRLRDANLVVLNVSRGDAYVDTRLASDSEAATVEEELSSSGVPHEWRQTIADREHVAHGDDAMVREIGDDIAVAVRAPEVIDVHTLAAKIQPHAVLERHVRRPRLIGLDHLPPRAFRGHDLDVLRLHLRIPAAVITVVVGVDDVADRLARDLSDLRHQVVEVDLELVVDEDQPLIRDEDRRVPWNEVVVDDEQVFPDPDGRQLRRLVAELRVGVRTKQGDTHRQNETDATFHREQLLMGSAGGSYLSCHR